MGRRRRFACAALGVAGGAMMSATACGTLLSIDSDAPGGLPDGAADAATDGASADAAAEGSPDGATGDASAEAAAKCKPGPPHRLGVYTTLGPRTFELRLADGGTTTFADTAPTSSATMPIAGRWTGEPADLVGTYDSQANGGGLLFSLFKENAAGADRFEGRVGGLADLPVAGDWDGDGMTTVGLYRRQAGGDPVLPSFYLYTTLSIDMLPAPISFPFGPTNVKALPVAGDWDCDGKDGVGLFVQLNNTSGRFYLRNALTGGNADATFVITYPATTSELFPVAGDWDGDGQVTVGLFDPDMAVFYLVNANTAGAIAAVVQFGTGGTAPRPIAGRWAQ